MISLDKVYKLLPPAKNIKVMTIDSQSTKDIIDQVLDQHKQNVKDAKKIAHLFDAGNAYGTCSNIWDFLKYQVPYKVEPSEKQSTKTISRIIYDAMRGAGNDCKHYSGFTGAILEALGYKFKYRFAGYSDYINTPTHVYCICTHNNNTIYVDAVINGFDIEKPYKLKIDKSMSLYKLSGVNYDTPKIGGLFDFVTKSIDQQFNYINKKVPIVKKIADVAGDAANKIKEGFLTATFAIPRNAVILLMKYNFKGWARGLQNKTFDDLEFWYSWFGGNRTDLMNAIKEGAKKPSILGIDEYDVLVPSSVGSIGEPLTISAAVAASAPILIKISDLLTKAEKVANQAEGIAKKVETTTNVIDQGVKTFEKTTGVNVKDVVWRKDTGTTGNKNSLSPNDFTKVDDATAKKIADSLARKAAEKKGFLPKMDNKMLLIGGGLALVGIYFATKKR
jgi:hypothetical protein